MAFSVESLDAWRTHFRARHVTILEGPCAFGDGRALVIEGPDGLVIELVEESRTEP